MSQTEKQRYDGWYNNLAHPEWGSVGMYARFIQFNCVVNNVDGSRIFFFCDFAMNASNQGHVAARTSYSLFLQFNNEFINRDNDTEKKKLVELLFIVTITFNNKCTAIIRKMRLMCTIHLRRILS